MQDKFYNKDKVNTNLSIIKDGNTSDHMALFSSYALNKYTLTFEGLKIKYKDIEAVIKAVMDVDKELVRTDFPITIFYDFYVLESENNLLTFDSYDNKKKVQINYYFKGSYEKSKTIFDAIQSFQDKDDELFVSISSFYQDAQKGIKVNELIKNKADFKKNSTEFYPYINTNEMFSQFMMSESNILLLAGTPGTGKTRLGDSFMEYLLDTTDLELGTKKQTLSQDVGDTTYDIDIITQESEGIKVAYIKNEEILSQDMLWNILQEDEYHLVFLDDLDYSLLPRTQNISTSEDIQKNKFISNLLSFTDGIFDSGNKTKFIITTNKTVAEIDSAVLRKGRTFDILELRELKHEEAGEIWVNKGLDLDEFNETFKDETVLQADLGTTINMKLKAQRDKVELKPYIIEEGISVYSKTKTGTKIGL